MTIQLRYTSGSPWVVELVNPKSKKFKKHYNGAFEYQSVYVRSNWRHLLSYFLGDKEMIKNALNNSKSTPRKNVLSWMFKIQHPGVEHKDLYVVLTDTASDYSSGVLCGKVGSASIWKSIVASVDAFLREKVDKVEPVEYELFSRYYAFGVAKRESKGNKLWCFTKEDGGRRNFRYEVKINEILERNRT